jgi:site-specific DNA recombinase
LWDKAEARLKELEEKHNARLLGGFNRAKVRDYLYSGLLFCGVCGSRMKIGGKQGSSVYECPNHRYRRGCTNHLRIREDRAAEQITSALSELLLVPENLTYLANAVLREIKAFWDTQRQEALRDGVCELEHAHRECQRRIDNLVDQIENVGPEPLIQRRLQERKFEKQRIEDKLSALKGRKKLDLTEEQLLAMVKENVSNLFDALRGEVPLARKLLLQYVRKMQLFPYEDEAGPAFEVLGELDLFAGPEDPESGVLLGCSGI